MPTVLLIVILFALAITLLVIVPCVIIAIHDGDNQRAAAKARRLAYTQRKI